MTCDWSRRFRPTRAALVLLLAILVNPGQLACQGLVGAAGAGPTPVHPGRSGNGNLFVAFGYQGRGMVGGRLSATETMSRVWLSGEVTLETAERGGRVRPYLCAGPGLVIDLYGTDPLIAAGGGLRAQLTRGLFGFAQAQLHIIIGPANRPPRDILPITIGVGLAR